MSKPARSARSAASRWRRRKRRMSALSMRRDCRGSMDSMVMRLDGPSGDVAGRAVGGGHPEVGELAAGERAVAVHALDHLALGRKVLVAPQPHRRKRADVAPRVRHQVFGADHTPAAFGLDLAHRGRGERRAVAGAVAVGDLVEAVRRRHRADAYRLEQHVEAWVPRHRGVFAPPPRPGPLHAARGRPGAGLPRPRCGCRRFTGGGMRPMRTTSARRCADRRGRCCRPPPGRAPPCPSRR